MHKQMRQLTTIRINSSLLSTPISPPLNKISTKKRDRHQPRTSISMHSVKIRLMRKPTNPKITLTRQTRPSQLSTSLSIRRIRRLHRTVSQCLSILRSLLTHQLVPRPVRTNKGKHTPIRNSRFPMSITTRTILKPRSTGNKSLNPRHAKTPRPINIPPPRMIISHRRILTTSLSQTMMSIRPNMITKLRTFTLNNRTPSNRMLLIQRRSHTIRRISHNTIPLVQISRHNRHFDRNANQIRASIPRISVKLGQLRLSTRPRNMTRNTMQIQRTMRRVPVQIIINPHSHRSSAITNRSIRLRRQLIQWTIARAHALSTRSHSDSTRHSNLRLKCTRQYRTMQGHNHGRILMHHRTLSINNPISQISLRSTIRTNRIRPQKTRQNTLTRRIQHTLNRPSKKS